MTPTLEEALAAYQPADTPNAHDWREGVRRVLALCTRPSPLPLTAERLGEIVAEATIEIHEDDARAAGVAVASACIKALRSDAVTEMAGGAMKANHNDKYWGDVYRTGLDAAIAAAVEMPAADPEGLATRAFNLETEAGQLRQQLATALARADLAEARCREWQDRHTRLFHNVCFPCAALFEAHPRPEGLPAEPGEPAAVAPKPTEPRRINMGGAKTSPHIDDVRLLAADVAKLADEIRALKGAGR